MPHVGWNIPKSITKPNGCWTYPKWRHFPAVVEIAATLLKWHGFQKSLWNLGYFGALGIFIYIWYIIEWVISIFGSRSPLVHTIEIVLMLKIVQPGSMFWNHILWKQDINNADEILSQILKSTVKMDGLLDKLAQLGTDEAVQKLVKLTLIIWYLSESQGLGVSSGLLLNLPHP